MISFLQYLILSENKIEFLAKQSGIPVPHIEKLATADPTPKKKYLPWLVNQVKRNKIRGDMLDTYHPDTLKLHKDALGKFYDSSLHHKLLDHPHGLTAQGYDAIATSVSDSSKGDKTLIDKMANKEDNEEAHMAVAKHFGHEDKYFNKLKNSMFGTVHKHLAKHRPEEYTKPESHFAGKLAAAGTGNEAAHDALIKNHPPEGEVPLRDEISAAIVRTGKLRHVEHFKDTESPDTVSAIRSRIPQMHSEHNGGDEGRKTLAVLATSKNPKIRSQVAHHASVHRGTVHLADKLIHDPVDTVRYAAIQNSDLSPELRKHVHENDPNPEIRRIAKVYRENKGEI